MNAVALRPTYKVRQLDRSLGGSKLLGLDWAGEAWCSVPVMTIDQFLPESSNHQPLTELKLQHSERGIHGLFRAQDQYVQCVQSQFQDRVARDNCVEIYFMPKPERDPGPFPHPSYINLEMSGNGTLLSYYIRDSERHLDAFKDFDPLSIQEGHEIEIESSLPAVVYPEIETKMEWFLEFFLPYSLLERFFGTLHSEQSSLSSLSWACNAFKCTEDSSHPHWASWAPCSEFNFHRPEDFGSLVFD